MSYIFVYIYPNILTFYRLCTMNKNCNCVFNPFGDVFHIMYGRNTLTKKCKTPLINKPYKCVWCHMLYIILILSNYT